MKTSFRRDGRPCAPALELSPCEEARQFAIRSQGARRTGKRWVWTRGPGEPLVLGALERLGERALVVGGWCGLGGSRIAEERAPAGGRRLGERVFAIPYVPHRWAFDRVSAVVHHGSTGTFAASLRAGCPTLTVPFFGDQPFWGMRGFVTGVGPKPVRRRGLQVEPLANAMRDVLTNETYRGAAGRIAAAIRQEDGTGSTAAYVERLLAQRRGRVAA